MKTANKKKWIFRFLTVFFGLLLLALLELILQLTDFGKNYDLVLTGKPPDKAGKYSLNSQYIALHYFHHLPVDLNSLFRKIPWFSETEFSKEKSPETFRIFLVGASTTRGFPYSSRKISYSGFLKNILQDVLPDRKIEVINAGYDALSSFGVLDVVETISDYSPDLIIVYSGHNEFIGHFGVNSTINYGQNRNLITFSQMLHHSRLYLLNELFILKIKGYSKSPARQGGINLFKVMLNQEKIHWDDEDHKISDKNYQLNLQEIAHTARRKGIPVIFSTLVSNLKDFVPIRSEFNTSLDKDKRNQIILNLQKGENALKKKMYKKGASLFKASLELDPGYAMAHFDLARAYEAQSKFKLARQEYKLARETDKVHLRACIRFNKIIHKVGLENNVPVIEMEQAFEKASQNGLIGNNFFLEHVHPNINGHLVMADVISHFLAPHNYIEPERKWNWKRMHKANEYVKASGFDQDELFKSRATIGRLLLDFPFFKCEEGKEMLSSVHQVDYERKLIQSCYENKKALRTF